MPKRVSLEWEESQYTNEAANLEKFHSAMESTGSQFTSQVETSNNNLDTAMSSVEGSWSDDDVFSKLKSMVNNTLKGGLEKIDTDVTSGSFLSLKNTVNLCKTCMDNCKQAKHDYDEAKNLFDRTSSTKKIDDPDNPGKKKTVHNDLYDTRKTDVEKKLNILKNKITSANTHLYELAQFAFGGPSSKNNIGGESTTGAGGIGATPPATEDPSEEAPSETPTDPSAAAKAKVEQNMDWEDVRDQMNNLFSYGIFQSAFTYNGQTVVLKDISGGSGREFALCDAAGNPIPGLPHFTKDQVVQADSYPEVEAALVDYFASQNPISADNPAEAAPQGLPPGEGKPPAPEATPNTREATPPELPPAPEAPKPEATPNTPAETPAATDTAGEKGAGEWITVGNDYNNSTEQLYQVKADFGEGERTYYFSSEETAGDLANSAALVTQMHDCIDNGSDITVMMDGKPVTVSYEYGNIPTSLPISEAPTTWAADSTSQLGNYNTVTAWDTTAFGNATFYYETADGDYDTMTGTELLQRCTPVDTI